MYLILITEISTSRGNPKSCRSSQKGKTPPPPRYYLYFVYVTALKGMMMPHIMMTMPYIISEYLGNPTSVRAPRGDMKCSSNKQTAQPVTSSHFIPDSILIFSFSSLFSAKMSTIFTADISHYCFYRR